MLNEKGVVTLLVTVERRVLTGSLPTVPEVHGLFNMKKFYWMTQDLGIYSEKIVWEFYASYVVTLLGSIARHSRPAKQDPLTSILVWGC